MKTSLERSNKTYSFIVPVNCSILFLNKGIWLKDNIFLIKNFQKERFIFLIQIIFFSVLIIIIAKFYYVADIYVLFLIIALNE